MRIDGIDNLLLRFAKCCTPVPGDNIVGVVTRGRGVSIHRRDCHNVKNSSAALKLLDAEWEENAEGLYPVEIEVTGMDSSHFLSDVVNAVAESKVNISALNARRTRDRLTSIRMTVTVKDINHLDNVISKINRVRDVYSVHRNRN